MKCAGWKIPRHRKKVNEPFLRSGLHSPLPRMIKRVVFSSIGRRTNVQLVLLTRMFSFFSLHLINDYYGSQWNKLAEFLRSKHWNANATMTVGVNPHGPTSMD